MKSQNKKKWLIKIQLVVMIFLGSDVYAMEIANDYSSSVVTQIATYVIKQIVNPDSQKEDSAMEVAGKIANEPDKTLLAAKIEKIRSHILLLEKGSFNKLKLSIVEPPIIINANVDLEINVLVFFTVNGTKLKSGMMTFQLISLYEKEGKITCGFKLGQVCFSTDEIIH